MQTWPTPLNCFVEGKDLVFELSPPGIRTAQAPASEFLLEMFVGLAEREEEELAAYGARYGLLSICEDHGMPSTHNPDGISVDGGRVTKGCRPRGYYTRRILEPIEQWRYFARRGQAVLNIAEALRSEVTPDVEDWRVLGQDAAASSLDVQRLALMYEVDTWIQLSGVRPGFGSDEEGRVHLGFRARTLFGALALQLAGRITDDEPLNQSGESNNAERRGSFHS